MINEELIDSVDAMVFNSDYLHNDANRSRFIESIKSWIRECNSIEDKKKLDGDIFAFNGVRYRRVLTSPLSPSCECIGLSKVCAFDDNTGACNEAPSCYNNYIFIEEE